LSGCEIYATGQPCPMCESAIAWSRIKKCYFGNDYKATSKVGFDDHQIHQLIQRKPNKLKLKLIQIDKKESYELYKKWINKTDKKMY
jgi:tRNA(Arg) A34 adenosine deaminase TadA